jgi:hypothetical protein
VYGARNNAYRILVEKSVGKYPLGGLRKKWNENKKMNIIFERHVVVLIMRLTYYVVNLHTTRSCTTFFMFIHFSLFHFTLL